MGDNGMATQTFWRDRFFWLLLLLIIAGYSYTGMSNLQHDRDRERMELRIRQNNSDRYTEIIRRLERIEDKVDSKIFPTKQ